MKALIRITAATCLLMLLIFFSLYAKNEENHDLEYWRKRLLESRYDTHIVLLHEMLEKALRSEKKIPVFLRVNGPDIFYKNEINKKKKFQDLLLSIFESNDLRKLKSLYRIRENQSDVLIAEIFQVVFFMYNDEEGFVYRLREELRKTLSWKWTDTRSIEIIKSLIETMNGLIGVETGYHIRANIKNRQNIVGGVEEKVIVIPEWKLIEIRNVYHQELGEIKKEERFIEENMPKAFLIERREADEIERGFETREPLIFAEAGEARSFFQRISKSWKIHQLPEGISKGNWTEINKIEKETKPLFPQITPWFSLGGEFEGEFIDSQGDSKLVVNTSHTTHDNHSVPRFSVDRLMLKPRITFPGERIYLEGELEFFGNSTNVFLKEAYLMFDFISHFFLKVGMDDRFILDPQDRGTEIYPLNGTAFWRDEDVGITFGGDHMDEEKKNVWYWRASLTNGLALKEQAIGKNPIYFMLHDDRQIDDITDSDKEFALGMGYKFFSENTEIDFMTFGFSSRLRKNVSAAQEITDVDFLQEVIPGYISNRQDNWFVGGQFLLSFNKLSFFSQYIFSRDGDIERHGFYIQPSLQWKFQDRDYFNGLEFLYRYNLLDIKTNGLADNIPTSSFTWDRETHSVALNVKIIRGMTWRNEYHFNLEDTGGMPDGIHNNDFLSQLEFRF